MPPKKRVLPQAIGGRRSPILEAISDHFSFDDWINNTEIKGNLASFKIFLEDQGGFSFYSRQDANGDVELKKMLELCRQYIQQENVSKQIKDKIVAVLDFSFFLTRQLPEDKRAGCLQLIREIKFPRQASSQRRVIPPAPNSTGLYNPEKINDILIGGYYKGNLRLNEVDEEGGRVKKVYSKKFQEPKQFLERNFNFLKNEYSSKENFFFKLCKDYLIFFNLGNQDTLEPKGRFEIDDQVESLVALFNAVLENEQLKSFADKSNEDGISPIELMIESYVEIAKYLQSKDIGNERRISAQQYADRCFDMVVGLSSKISLTKDEILAIFTKYQGDTQSLDIDRLRDLVVKNVEEKALIFKREQGFSLDVMKMRVRDFVGRDDNNGLKEFLVSVKDDLTQEERMDLVDVVSDTQSSALHVASKKHDLDLTSLLLKEFGVKNVNKLDGDGKTALDYARRFKLSRLLEGYYAKKSESLPQRPDAPPLPNRIANPYAEMESVELEDINAIFKKTLKEKVDILQADFSRLMEMKSRRLLNYKTAAERQLQQRVETNISELSEAYASYFFIDTDNLWRSLPDIVPAEYQYRDALKEKLNMRDGASLRAEFLKDKYNFCKEHVVHKEGAEDVKDRLKLLEAKYSFSLLHEAASRQDKELMQYLFRHCGKEMNDLDSRGRSAWEVYENSLKESYKDKLASNPAFVASLKKFISAEGVSEDDKIREYNSLYKAAQRALASKDSLEEDSLELAGEISEDVMRLISGISEDLAAYNTTKEGDRVFFDSVSREGAENERYNVPTGKVSASKVEDYTPILEQFNEVLFLVSQSIEEERKKFEDLKKIYNENPVLREGFVNQKDFNGNSFFHYAAKYEPEFYGEIKEAFGYSGREINDKGLSVNDILAQEMTLAERGAERVGVAAADFGASANAGASEEEQSSRPSGAPTISGPHSTSQLLAGPGLYR